MAQRPKLLKVSELSEGARAAIDRKKIEGARTFAYWKALLEELANFDDVAESWAVSARRRALLGTFVLILSVVALSLSKTMFQLGLGRHLFQGTALALTMISGGFSIFYWPRAWRLAKVDLGEDFQQVLLPLLVELEEDIDPEAPLKLELDLRGLSDEKKVSDKILPPGRFDKLTETVHRDPWLKVAMRLTDQNVIYLEMEKTQIRSYRAYHGSSGRYKTKTKWKKVVEVSAALEPGAEGWSWNDLLVDQGVAARAYRVREREGRRIVGFSRKFKFASESEPPAEEVKTDDVLKMLFELFAMRKPIEKGA